MKILSNSILFFSHNVSYPLKDKLNVLGNMQFVVCKYFQFGQNAEISSSGIVLTLPYEEILDLSNLTEITEYEVNVQEMMRNMCCLERVASIVEIAENDGYQHVLLFPQCFQ